MPGDDQTTTPRPGPGADGAPPLEGEAARRRLRASLDEVAVLVPYLLAVTEPVAHLPPGAVPGGAATGAAGGGWLPCGGLLDDPRWLRAVVGAAGPAIGTGDPVVAASIFVQGYAYRLLALSVACLCVGGVVPDCDPATMAVGLSRGRPARVAFESPRLAVPGDLAAAGVGDAAATALLEAVVARHLRPLTAGVRHEIRIGQRLLWGNVAASAAAAFRTMEGVLGPGVVPVASRFFDLAPSELQGLGDFVTVGAAGRRGWFWERRNCCLFDRTEAGTRCADCSRTPEAERRQKFAASLTG